MLSVIHIQNDEYAIVDLDTNQIKKYQVSQLEAEKQALIETMPTDITDDDKALLAWAKVNYPVSSDKYLIEINSARVSEITSILELIEQG